MATTAAHRSILKKLREETGQEKLDLICPTVIAAMDARYKFTSTRAALSALRKEYPGCQHFIDEMSKRMPEYKKLDTTQEPTESQVAKFVPWDKLCEFRDMYADEMSPVQNLLMALYTYIPPVRLDFTPMRVLRHRPDKLEDGINYCILTTHDPVFIFHAFKTAKKMGDREVDIPPKLRHIIESWIKPGQQWLLEDADGPWPEYRLGVTIQKIFKKFHNMDTSVSTFRHSYLTKYYAGDKSLADINSTAGSMMHAPMTAMAYRHISLE